MAPLEGITGFVFRNAYEKYYSGVDCYFTPFITPHTKKNMDARERRDILPENNKVKKLVPQVMTNRAEELISISRELSELGYREINLNLGCPSGTVAAKGKGSGFLKEPDALERFFDTYFSQSEVPLSVKTRIGMEEEEEWERLLGVYQKFPFTELIVHPRLQKEFYRGTVHLDAFIMALKQCSCPVCYNGDLFRLSDYERWKEQIPACDRIMLGRGLLWNPQLACEIREGSEQEFDPETFFAFHDAVVSGYQTYISGDRNVLFRLKELWGYWIELFPGEKKLLKKIRKAGTLMEYAAEVQALKARSQARA